MKAIISSSGLIAFVASDNQHFVVSAGPMQGGGYSVGIENARLAVANTEDEARAKVREIVAFFAKDIKEA